MQCQHHFQYAIADYTLKKINIWNCLRFSKKGETILFNAWMEVNLSPYRVREPIFNCWIIQPSPKENDVDFAKWLTKTKGVASIPISVFYEDKKQDNLLRFCFAKDLEELEKGAERLLKV